ncbi:MAG: cell division protein FtsL [Alcanivoracaceae bacterium]|jgi:cell division protein FtsL|nr:cell division protein FtsL [Alcanivoracaceae bacterium]
MHSQPFLEPLLVVLIVMSALAVSWSVHETRRLTSQAQQLQGEHDRLQTEWGQLLLEHSTWGSYARVEQMARQQLGMTLPKPEQTVLVNP